MPELRLFLIRHASAAERSSEYPDDSQRPLIHKGLKQARQLSLLFKQLDITLDRLFSSPYTRAAQTAEPLSQVLVKGRRVEYLDSLSAPNYLQLTEDIHAHLHRDDQVVALVGHEPYMSTFASYLLTGRDTVLAIRFKKGAVMELSGPLEAGQMTLYGFMPASSYKYL
jgi:phosphohistidine phosphatase